VNTKTSNKSDNPEPQYQTRKGCLMLLAMLLVLGAMTVVGIVLFGNRTP